MRTIKHTIRLKGFDLEEGKITFSFLEKLARQIVRVSESSVLAMVEGNSALKRGRPPGWLERSIDFELTGIKAGSTILEVEAPQLSDTLPDSLTQTSGRELNFDNQSALDLTLRIYEEVLSYNERPEYLDRYLLQEMYNFNSLLSKKGAAIEIASEGKRRKPVIIEEERLKKIKEIELQIPSSMKTRITGKLDVIKYTSGRIEILTPKGRVRAYLSGKVGMNDIAPFIGKEVTFAGTAHFNLRGDIASFEIAGVTEEPDKGDFFREMPRPLSKTTDLKALVSKQHYKGTRLDDVIGKWPGDEDIDDLLSMLKE
jgi:hypothetical protein